MTVHNDKYRLPEGQQFEVFGQMMTEEEYDAWCEGRRADWQTPENAQLIKACVMGDVDKAREVLGEKSDGHIAEVQYVGYRKKIPAHMLTQYSMVMWECWGDKAGASFGSQMREHTRAMERFWREYYGWQQMPEIDWRPCIDFREEFYFDDDDILESAVKRLGHRPMDAELFQAMGMFDFAKVESLLQQGANPNKWLLSPPDQKPTHYEWNALMEVWNESPDATFMEEFNEAIGEEEDAEWDIVTLIFNAAAYANMFNLLRRYGYDPADMREL